MTESSPIELTGIMTITGEPHAINLICVTDIIGESHPINLIGVTGCSHSVATKFRWTLG